MDENKAISGYEKIFDDGYKAGRASVVLPHPCDGELYRSWTSSDYFAKIAEEHLEDSEKSDPMKNTECILPEYLDEYFRDKKIDGEIVTLLRGEKYGKLALRVGGEIYEVLYKYLRKVDKEDGR